MRCGKVARLLTPLPKPSGPAAPATQNKLFTAACRNSLFSFAKIKYLNAAKTSVPQSSWLSVDLHRLKNKIRKRISMYKISVEYTAVLRKLNAVFVHFVMAYGKKHVSPLLAAFWKRSDLRHLGLGFDSWHGPVRNF